MPTVIYTSRRAERVCFNSVEARVIVLAGNDLLLELVH
jgi:hypothetical protein